MFKLLLLLYFFLFGLSLYGEGQEAVVYKIDIKEEIGPSIWRIVKKSFENAERLQADYIVIDMNTYGGMVVYADSLRSLILNSRKPVWVFIDNNAASAGALISLACDKIYMREGASLGAATVVDQSGAAMPDKYQSYMRSMMRATAQAQGRDTIVQGRDTVYTWRRDPRIAEAMVDQSIYISGISDSGKIVTFTPHEAMKYGFCDGIADNIDEVLQAEQVKEYVLETYVPTWQDEVIGFFIHPFVRGILIMIILGGIYFELQTPGIGFPLAAAAVACILYFAPLYLEGMAASWEILLFALGLILLGLELFVIPGFGVTGIAGILCIFIALILAGVGDFSYKFWGDFAEAILHSLLIVLASSIVSLGLSIWLAGKLFGTRRLGWALQARQRPEDGYVGVDMNMARELKQEGEALTDLRPAGKVTVNGEIYDAVSDLGEYIVKGTPVQVVKFQAGQLYVIRKPV